LTVAAAVGSNPRMANAAAESTTPELRKDLAGLWVFWLWIAAVWALLFAAASYGWRYGEYYDHGWFVPPLAGWMLWRRAKALGPPRCAQLWPAWLSVAMVVVAVAAFVPLRVLERVDPRWALPLWTHGLVAALITHGLVARAWGLGASRALLPWTALALSALALPTLIERTLVTSLTNLVLAATQGILTLSGMLVEVMGDRLLVDGKDVTVTEGCSGIRSGHAFLMASLFFGEWMALNWPRRAVMLLLALVTAWAVNVARATTLALAHFEGDPGALDRWHDNVGLAAYVVGSAILLGIAAAMERRQRGRPVKVKKVVKVSRS
jgi:exosortase